MTQFEDAVLAIGAFLEAEGIPHMVIGGVANLFWGVGSLPFERAAIRRARLMSVAGQRVRICTAEDLIITKIVSDRPRDREDVAGIIRTQGAGLDRGYLDPLIEGLAAEMGRPDLFDFYRRCVSEEV
jgi:hypothetical protein